MNRLIPRLSARHLVSIFVISITFSLMMPFVAHAGFSNLPTVLPDIDTSSYIRLSTKGDESSTGAQDYAKVLSILVYKDSASLPGTARLHFNSGDSCEGKTIKYASVPADDSGNRTNPNGLWHFYDSNDQVDTTVDPDNATTTMSPCNGRIKIPNSAFANSDRFGGSIKVAILRIELTSPDSVFTFNIGRFDAGDRIRLSTIGVNSNDSNTNNPANPPRSYGTLLKVRGGGSKMTAKFGVPCQFAAGQQRIIFWKGADSNTSINPGTVGIDIIGGSSSLLILNAGNGSNVKASQPLDMNAGDKFTVTFKGITNDNNAILLWLPFDSAVYDKDCGTNDSWEVGWTDGYIGRGGTALDKTVGNESIPDLPGSPEPGQTFDYVFDAENVGNRNISNIYYTRVCTNTTFNNSNAPNPWCARYTGSWTGYHYREYSQYYHAVNLGYNPPYNTVPPNFLDYLNNTQTTPVTKYTTDTPSGALLYNNTGTGVAPGNSILTAGQRTAHSWGVTASDGGKTFCVQLTASPSKGTSKTSTGLDVYNDSNGQISNNTEHTTSWVIGGTATSPMLCVVVPHFYNLTLPGISVDATVQQGSNVDVSGSVRETNEGLSTSRPHTNTKNGMERGIVEVKLAPGEPEPSPSIGGSNQVGQAPCDYMIARVPGSELATCTKDFNGSRATNPVAAGATETLSGSRSNTTEAVGTKYCYATYAQHPRHINNDDYTNGDSQYSYSNISCSVIVKSPKVHFLNNDLTVGRLRDKAADGSCVVGGAPIIARGVPDSVSANNLYGSWVSNGAFATGAINGFGSAARPVGLAGGGHDNLTFGNQSGGLGRYSYSNCLPNPFGEVKDDDSTNLASHSAFVLKADDPTTGMLTMVNLNNQAQDKTGYVSDGKSIEVGQKTVAPPPSAVPPDSVMTTVRINARSVHANPGNVSCPKLQVVVTGDNSSRDQDTKPICDTAHQDYVYSFYLPTNGPKTIDVRFVNDSSGGGAVNRDIQIRTIAANNKNLYTGTTGGAAVPGVTVTMRGAAANKSSCRTANGVLLDIVYGSNDTSYCYSSLVLSGDLDAPLATQNPSYVPPESKTIQVTARGTIYNLHGGGGACPYMFINVNNGQRQDLQQVCETSESTYTFTTNTGNTNIDNIEVGFDPMDAYGGGQDRNLYVSNIRVGDANFAINQSSEANVQFKNGNTFVSAAAAPGTCKNANTAIFLSATDNVTTGYCAAIRVNNVTPPTPPEPPVTPLDDDFVGFNGRDIVIYAKKTVGDTCNATSTGNININQNIIYKRTGFTSLFDLPRVTFIADCNIIIDDAVTDVNASLIAGDAIKTCSKKATNKDQCNQTLLVKGNISANRLLLWRTHGADLSIVGDDKPGETFDISPAQVVSRYNRDQRSAKPTPTYEVDLPPRY